MKAPKRKYRWLRRIARVIIVLVGLFIIACFVADHYLQFRKSDKDLTMSFRQRGLDAQIGYYTTHERKLRYIHSGHDSLPTLLFLHGSPGSISYYSGRFSDSLLKRTFKMYAVDRPGYGYSGFGRPEASIQVQSEMLVPLLDSLHKVTRPVIIIGSSYGSSIACRLAMDHPDLVDGLVLTGPSLGPGRETYFWFNHIIEHWSIRWCMPRLFRSANTEKVYHKEELEKMLPYWKDIRVPVAYLQGENDEIVDTSNAGFAREQLVNVPYLGIRFIKDRGHRLAQFEWPEIRQSILDVYGKVRELELRKDSLRIAESGK